MLSKCPIEDPRIVFYNRAMYQPPHFREERIEVQRELIRAHPLGLLITAGPSGLLANPIPFLISGSAQPAGILKAHLARANPQWRDIGQIDECLVVFQGPQDYITPSWYPTKQETGKVVPTWSYVSVHVRGEACVMADQATLLQHVRELSDHLEAGQPMPWSVDDTPGDYVVKLARGIVGISIPVSAMEGVWKVNQHRSEEDPGWRRDASEVHRA